MDKIGRLRALEKDIRDSVSESNATHTHLRASGWADRLATLIAELGQEVGAVAYIVPVARVTSDGSYEDGPPQLCFADEADDYVRRVGAPLYTSPAHTSEARDAELTDAQCIAAYDAVSRSNITRDVKKPERKAAVVREALEASR